jgi:hypothetical protein
MREIFIPLARKVSRLFWVASREDYDAIAVNYLAAEFERVAEVAFFAGIVLGLVLATVIAMRF